VSKSHKTPLAIGALILVQMLFGVNFVSSKHVVSYIDPSTFASLRFLIAGITLYAFAASKDRILFPKIESHKTWILLLTLSVVGIALSQSLFLWGLKHSTSTNTAILSTSIPMFTLLIVRIRGQSELSWRMVTGFAISLIALLIFYGIEHVSFGSETLHGDLAILLSCCLMAGYISFCKELFAKIPLLWGTTLLFLFGGLVLLPTAVQNVYSLLNSMTELPPDRFFWYAFFYSVFAATLVTYFLNNWAYRHVSPAIISLFIYLQPIAAAEAAYHLFGETLSSRKILAAILIFAGMIFAVSGSLFAPKGLEPTKASPNS
jgi:drug/metabolite transporter (DMT)-like permease